ncbi:MAG: hypothetical protein KGJ05_10410, partial [Alphaproteobacteria bacterium]|nr:hypothetical protein [Alphaproteobacteria bacterium]
MIAASRIHALLPRANGVSEKWAGVRAEAVRLSRWLQYGAIGMMCALAVGVFAQLEGGDRGVAPIDSTSSYEVSGIMIDETADNAEDARMAGWREAQRKGWQMLWQKMHGTAGPVLSDDALDSMIEAVVVEDEQISEHRYIARLGILFDRVRSSQVLGISGTIVRSPPLLVIPVMWDAGTAQVFETRTPWQTAWAHFRAGSSPIS